MPCRGNEQACNDAFTPGISWLRVWQWKGFLSNLKSPLERFLTVGLPNAVVNISAL